MSPRPVLHFYQKSSKYSKGYSSYRADKKFYANADADADADAEANGIRPKNNMSPPFGRGKGHNSQKIHKIASSLKCLQMVQT